jgi:hypothetical protein
VDRLFFIWLGLKNHDGKIRVEETKVEGMMDFLQFPAVHTELPNTPGIILQTFAASQGSEAEASSPR